MPHFPYRAGNYILFAELGTGTLGTTYIGREATTGRGQFKPLAVRILDPHMSQRPDIVRMFLDEQRAAAVLQHPRIASVHEVGGMPDGSYFVASEYVHGVPVREVLRTPQASLSVAHAVHIAMQVCDALHYAHERHDVTGKPLEIVHGQLSSDAVLVGFDGNIKIIEFGCLRTRNATVTNTSVPTKLQRRTAYMAPELRAQVQANAVPNVDRRADIYSVGALLWELLTGEPLSVEDTNEPPPAPSSKREVPPELDTIVKTALAAKKDERYPTALAMRAALSAASASLFGESSVSTILARNMTMAFRQRLGSFQEQIDLWKKFEPDSLPASSEPLNPSVQWRTGAGTGGPSAFQSQRLATNQSQRLNVGSVNLGVGGTGGSGGMNTGNMRVDSANMRSTMDRNLPPEAQPIFKKPLFVGLLSLGVLAVLIAVVVTVIRANTPPWAVYVDSQPRGAEIRIDGKVVGNTPQRVTSTTPPKPLRIEIYKKNYRPYVREVAPQAGETVPLEAELEPEEPQR